MTSSKKLAAAAVVLLALLVPAVALATSEHASTKGFPEGYLAINPKTCKFLVREIDQPLGPAWTNLRKAFIWEDARHDTKLSCLTKKVDGASGGVAGAVAGYAQVKKTGTGATVTVTCPTGVTRPITRSRNAAFGAACRDCPLRARYPGWPAPAAPPGTHACPDPSANVTAAITPDRYRASITDGHKPAQPSGPHRDQRSGPCHRDGEVAAAYCAHINACCTPRVRATS